MTYKPRKSAPHHTDYDLIVIGTGAGGEVAAYLAAEAGHKVAIVESHVVGGECPNFGCVPTKALLHASEIYTAAKNGSKFGIHANPTIDGKGVKAWKDQAVRGTGTYAGSVVYKREGIRYIHGRAHFLDPWTVSIAGNRYTAHKFLVATGSHSIILPITGLKEAGFITHEEAINLTKIPKSLFVIGGGPIGSEFAQYYAAMGTKVSIADITDRIVAIEDPEVGILIGELFTRRGINVLTSAKVVRIKKTKQGKVVSYEKDGKTHTVTVEEILCATGKAPNTDLGLENAGVAYDKRGITVNKYMQTSAKHIYAAGDVVGPYRFTHTASYQSRIVAKNIFRTIPVASVDYRAVPRCVFVEPEVACVGPTEQQLKDQKVRYQSAMVPISIIGRANTSDVHDGFVKVIADKKGRLLSASIVSPRAGEMIHELTLAIQHRLKASDIYETIHAFPTWSEAVRMACHKIKST